METKKRFRSEALQVVYEKVIGDDPQRQADFEQEVVNVEVAQLIYDMRTKASLSQRELAKRVGTTASVICRLEDSDYEGHTLTMVRRIATALNRRLELRAVPIKAASARTRPAERSHR
ncbi:MAG TPA: helix-turn-helix domain-containing protein [Bryobacteraceae bacterium]|jgi:ribosome-binding protein aMBF1 (putative translation factor)|nr:helix-turn-helix domain-containing protein [Bryobacteraceae bacterium]